MGLRSPLARLAAGAPVPLFPVIGAGARRSVEALRIRPELELVDSPRWAEVVLFTGHLTAELFPAALLLHDQAPRPRLAAWWPLGAPDEGLGAAIPGLVVIRSEEDLARTVAQAHPDLLSGRKPSSPPALLDVEPAPWRGVGPYGQGGKGMTGGLPYGRPLAGRGPDRDGLALDRLPARVGPAFPPFPPGLVLEVTLQGDV
ncbi:MAG: hypothetical protein M3N51_08310, partial [Actinomycetota bacterium]|nr:hypothetical protein [Actinomycetota bacterium]